MQANKTVEVFCSYAHEDESWLRKLEPHLSLLKRQGRIALWHDRLIVPGADWTKSIDIHLETASVILLLVSADFLASDYCYSIEMKQALERHEAGAARVIPLLVRPVDWKNAPFAHLHVLPTDARPLSTWQDEDAALTEVVVGIRRVLEDLPLLAASAPRVVLPAIWNVPYRRNPHFTGRDGLLDQLRQQLIAAEQNDTAKICGAALTQPQAVQGLGGIGKTQIAVEYAYRYCQDYQVVLWVRVDTREALISDYVEIAKLLNLPQKDDQDQTLVVQAVLQWFKTHTQWLLIFDNADDLSLVHTYLPMQGNGSIIITTRAHAIDKFGSIEVERMGLKEGREFLLNRTNRLEYVSDEERKKATDIAIVLDLLPLALDQAGAYIEETGCSFSDYLLVYQARRKELLDRRGGNGATKEHPVSVAATFSLSFQKVEQANPSAAELLRLSAFLAPDKIPEELIRDCANLWSSPLQQAADLFAFNGMMEELLKYSLVNRLLDNKAFSIHRLVQAVQIDTMEKDMQCKWAERVIQAVNKVFPDNPEDVSVWSQCLRYLDQVQACNTLIKQYTLPLLEAADLLNRTGSYLKMQASYTLAEPLFERALAIREQQVGSEHPDVAVALNGLAVLYFEQEKHAEAEPLFKRALAIWEELGQKHPNVAVALNGLASLYFMQGKYKEAESLFKRAQRIMISIPGHHDVAYSLNNLATLYQSRGSIAKRSHSSSER